MLSPDQDLTSCRRTYFNNGNILAALTVASSLLNQRCEKEVFMRADESQTARLPTLGYRAHGLCKQYVSDGCNVKAFQDPVVENPSFF